MSADGLAAVVTLELFVVIAAARLLGVAFRALGQPQVVGEVVSGILLGPSLLGWVAPGWSAALFPPAALPVLRVISEYGIVFFMFLVGLELDSRLLVGQGRTALFISQASIVVPMLGGVVLARRLYGEHAPPGVPFESFALFMAAAMSVTAFPVLARILLERDLLQTRVGALAIICAAFDDVAAWCLLAFVVAVASAGSFAGATRTLVLAAVYVVVMIAVVRPVLARLAAVVDRSGRLSQNVVAVVFLLVLASAMTTHAIGVHAIFGAFAMGVVLPKDALFARELVEKIEDFAVVFLLPVYFAFTGLRTAVGLVGTPALWVECAIVLGVATLGKFGGSTLAARFTGVGWREASAIGVLMNTRGLMELVILNIGYDLGVVSPALFAMLVVMALVTTLMTTPVLAVVYPVERLREDRAAAATARPVVVAVALPRSGPLLLDVGAALAESAESPLYALHLARPPERGSLAGGAPAASDGRALGPTLAHAAARGRTLRPVELSSRNPAEDIREVARVKGAALVVMGWHKPVWTRSVLGGTVHAVMRASAADVAVFIDRGLDWPPRRILVPFAGGRHDRAAVRLAERIAAREGAACTVLHVVRPGGAGPAPAPDGAGARVRVVRSPSPIDAVLAEAAGHDLVVLGVGEDWALEPHVFGLRSERLVADCPASLLVVRGGAASEA